MLENSIVLVDMESEGMIFDTSDITYHGTLGVSVLSSMPEKFDRSVTK